MIALFNLIEMIYNALYVHLYNGLMLYDLFQVEVLIGFTRVNFATIFATLALVIFTYIVALYPIKIIIGITKKVFKL